MSDPLFPDLEPPQSPPAQATGAPYYVLIALAAVAGGYWLYQNQQDDSAGGTVEVACEEGDGVEYAGACVHSECNYMGTLQLDGSCACRSDLACTAQIDDTCNPASIVCGDGDSCPAVACESDGDCVGDGETCGENGACLVVTRVSDTVNKYECAPSMSPSGLICDSGSCATASGKTANLGCCIFDGKGTCDDTSSYTCTTADGVDGLCDGLFDEDSGAVPMCNLDSEGGVRYGYLQCNDTDCDEGDCDTWCQKELGISTPAFCVMVDSSTTMCLPVTDSDNTCSSHGAVDSMLIGGSDGGLNATSTCTCDVGWEGMVCDVTCPYVTINDETGLPREVFSATGGDAPDNSLTDRPCMSTVDAIIGSCVSGGGTVDADGVITGKCTCFNAYGNADLGCVTDYRSTSDGGERVCATSNSDTLKYPSGRWYSGTATDEDSYAYCDCTIAEAHTGTHTSKCSSGKCGLSDATDDHACACEVTEKVTTCGKQLITYVTADNEEVFTYLDQALNETDAGANALWSAGDQRDEEEARSRPRRWSRDAQAEKGARRCHMCRHASL